MPKFCQIQGLNRGDKQRERERASARARTHFIEEENRAPRMGNADMCASLTARRLASSAAFGQMATACNVSYRTDPSQKERWIAFPVFLGSRSSCLQGPHSLSPFPPHFRSGGGRCSGWEAKGHMRWPKRTTPRREAAVGVAAGALVGCALLCIGPGSGPSSLYSWGQLGASLDNSVPQQLNAGASDVGGVLVREHAPSGRLPGFGGGSHLLNDGVVAVQRDMRHDLGFRRSARERALAIMRHRQRARSLALARDVLRRARRQEGTHLQQMAMRRDSGGRRSSRGFPQSRMTSVDHGITEGTLEAVYRRATRLAAEQPAAHKPSRADIDAAYKNAARLAASAVATASRNAPSSTRASTAEVITKAADALRDITHSVNTDSFAADPQTMATMAASLASLSSALANEKKRPPRSKPGSTAPAEAPLHLHSLLTQGGDATAVGLRQETVGAHAKQESQRARKIEEDILFHLGQLRLNHPRVPATSRTSGA